MPESTEIETRSFQTTSTLQHDKCSPESVEQSCSSWSNNDSEYTFGMHQPFNDNSASACDLEFSIEFEKNLQSFVGNKKSHFGECGPWAGKTDKSEKWRDLL
ncbi:hypothetical protein GUITHDRAFT_155852 [Guillardia theta CCMP2712]|uniref:Uncharacterized protein n=1 Tax=Guillardia theta (strain CCMP2712) TaxID=905079 RepID=L1ICQ8_GUITC|nr:hypothetical protein GUITHDRAFT_155852 [Guillardia theta CCMP2712]EKX34036.1 hypothetical protein GUITHDRAFT_155852 [Guillardia theta CCMP2712]|mmetsp:Transcript_51908/g.161496  ORF Transcript_51908/g.161496 Transcript_51908/m.161496 type:complete len:102 (-) Transcript_51908:79-384(-)|eukprot:XP_005821016.1 hypothetical protein GUITHDRAFT_155852 [Guillardia theta CCMP2712]